MVPLTVMREAFRSFELLAEMIEKGNPNSVTDAAVGIFATRACIRGAFLNVRINVKGLKDKSFSEKLLAEGSEIDKKTTEREEYLISNSEKVI
jgi:glutamate formiminotransferase/formiminotetrahydrofolate cyclodeaminase